MARILIRFILDHWVPEGPIYLAGDDTVDEHRGAKVYGKGCHRDPVRSTHSYTAYRWGHKWVVLAILVKFPFASRAWALPVLAALYRNPEKAPGAKAAAAKARRKKKDKGQAKAKAKAKEPAAARPRPRPRSPRLGAVAAAAQDALGTDAATAGDADPLVPQRQFVFAGDGGYGSHALAGFAARHRRL